MAKIKAFGTWFLLSMTIQSTMSGQLAADESKPAKEAAAQASNALVWKQRLQVEQPLGSGQFVRQFKEVTWSPAATAVIVCDVWDYHHSLNAVRRLDEFLPRLNDFITVARQRGCTIIHAPSDCMDAYPTHPSRQRAIAVPQAKRPLPQAETWCSRIPSEERAVYPLDQSDGGDDDDPQEHVRWASKLTELGRNPALPWKRQNDQIKIAEDQDYITDRGIEVWNILEQRQIQNVVLVGVHTNMCVIGRPFGLRQMARGGKQVVLVRDLTDCMYNPQRWPYVDHFTGNDLIVSHIERHVCPTITSNQLLGGEAFRFANDRRQQRDITTIPDSNGNSSNPDSQVKHPWERHWTITKLPDTWENTTQGVLDDYTGVTWYRCAVRLPSTWLKDDGPLLEVPYRRAAGNADPTRESIQAWCNGQPLPLIQLQQEKIVGDPPPVARRFAFRLQAKSMSPDDLNLIVLKVNHQRGDDRMAMAPVIRQQDHSLSLSGRWQFRIGDDPAFSNVPLPARFAFGTDMVFQVLTP